MNGNPNIYFDISIDETKVGRIVCELFAEKAPKTVENFYQLCLGDRCVEQGKPLTYKDNYFHRVIKNFMIQCGDILYCSTSFKKTDNTGKGGCSIYATQEELQNSTSLCYGDFQDENLGTFEKPFCLAMANMGSPNTNSSQFFITTYPAPHLNGKHSIFGRVIHGKSVVRTIERFKVDSDGFPHSCIRIEGCGKWEKSDNVPLYNASNDTIGGDIFEEFPDDNENFDSENFDVAYLAANSIKESGTLLFKKKDYQNAYFKYKKSLRYVNEYIPDLDVDKQNNIKFTQLRSKIYLNLSLVLCNLCNYDESIKYATYLLDMEGIPDVDQAKAYYRRGNCYLAKKRLDEALIDYKSCKEKNPEDKVITEKIEYIEELLEENKQKTRKSISKFFSGSS